MFMIMIFFFFLIEEERDMTTICLCVWSFISVKNVHLLDRIRDMY
jgi:hypothetical protein